MIICFFHLLLSQPWCFIDNFLSWVICMIFDYSWSCFMCLSPFTPVGVFVILWGCSIYCFCQASLFSVTCTDSKTSSRGTDLTWQVHPVGERSIAILPYIAPLTISLPVSLVLLIIWPNYFKYCLLVLVGLFFISPR